ncbi:MAG: transporter substrate-binding domain-containing protein [Tatlockia sp.]|nr:transporter substrate-binding domain-containing protein [Tatlockia sp.]
MKTNKRSSNLVRIGITGDYPPFSFYNTKTNAFEGFDVEMANSLSLYTGIKIEFVKTTWSTFERDLFIGKFDVAMGGVSITEEREKRFMFSLPILCDGKVPLINRGKSKELLSFEAIDRSSVKLAVNPGGTNDKFIKEKIQYANVIMYTDIEAIFNDLDTANFDVMITDRIEALYRQAKHANLVVVNPEQLLTSNFKGYMFKKNDVLKKIIDGWLENMLASPTFQALFKKHFNFPGSEVALFSSAEDKPNCL